MLFIRLFFLSPLSSLTSAALISQLSPPSTSLDPLHFHTQFNNQTTPVVLWHGLGDAYDNAGISKLAQSIELRYPNTPVYLIRLADSGSQDRRATWFGSANEEVQSVCDQLPQIAILSNGFDAIGFSQGGQLMRAYVERCNFPKVRNLITLGAQHMGISGFQPCKSLLDLSCHIVHKLIDSQTVYGNYAQQNIIPAQYFRDQANLSPYMHHNQFLRDINNERYNDSQPIDGAITSHHPGLSTNRNSQDGDEPEYQPRNQTYKINFQSLENFVMFQFTIESLVIPPTSAYFTIPNTTAQHHLPGDVLNPIPIALQDLPIYQEDYIGLKVLDKAGKIHYGTCFGEHMVIDEDCWENVMDWLGDGKKQTSRSETESLTRSMLDGPGAAGQIVLQG